MKIVCCIKQVPAIDQLQFDAKRHTVVREGVGLEINAFDRRAIAEAVALKRHLGPDRVQVVAMTMGPPQAAAALREGLALGADRAVHLCDPQFAGSDTLATARALSRALAREQADLLLFGQYSLDADTGHVGPQVAELLGLPCVTGVRRITVGGAPELVEVEREVEDGQATVRVPLPALLTVLDRQTRPMRPSPVRRSAMELPELEAVSALDLNLTPNEVGMVGSPTWVDGLEVMASRRVAQVLAGLSPAEAAVQLADYLFAHGVFTTTSWSEAKALPRRTADPAKPTVWVLAEPLADGLRPVTFELLGKANDLAAQTGGAVVALALHSLAELATRALAAAGADRVIVVLSTDAPDIGGMRRGAALAATLGHYQPAVLLAPSTPYGREAAARAAARLGLGLTADCLDVALGGDGRLVASKPALGGAIVARIRTRTDPQLATVRPGVLPMPQADPARRATVEVFHPGGLPVDPVTIVERVREVGDAAHRLEHAPVVIGVGTGIEGDWNLPMVRELAEVLGAAIGGTRRAAETGLLPAQLQVGLTGKAIAPRIYLALGVRGTFNHMVGSRRAGTIVAVNLDPDADIFQAADFGVVGDVLKIVPLLTQELKRRRQRA